MTTAIDKPRCSCGKGGRFISYVEVWDSVGRGNGTITVPYGWSRCSLKDGWHAPEAK